MKITERRLRSIIKNIIKEQSDINPRGARAAGPDLQQKYSVDLINTLRQCNTLSDIHALMKKDGFSEEDFEDERSNSYQYFWFLYISVCQTLEDLQREGYKVGFVMKLDQWPWYTADAKEPSSGEDYCAILLK